VSETVDEELLRIRSKAVAIVSEINQIEADAKHWNAAHPDEAPLLWDDGYLSALRGVLQNFLSLTAAPRGAKGGA